MAQVRHLRRAPIQEAVIDLSFIGDSLSMQELESLAARHESRGWAREEIHRLQATIRHSAREADQLRVEKSEPIFEGFAFKSPNGQHIVQYRGGRVTVSRIRGYTTWEDLVDEAMGALGQYMEIRQSAVLERIGVRFINRICPNPSAMDFEDVLERAPQRLPGLEGARISNFLRRHVVEGLQGNFQANLTIGTALPEEGEMTGRLPVLVIDVDVYKHVGARANIELVADELKIARDLKNLIFFGSLKESVLEAFE